MDAEERTQPESRIQCRYLRPFVLGLLFWEAAIRDEGSDRFRYSASMAEIARDRNFSRGNMFERYTEKARRVIFFARYEASQFGSPYIETEHLLLGLLRED